MELLEIAVDDDRTSPRDRLTTLEDAINDINVFRKAGLMFSESWLNRLCKNCSGVRTGGQLPPPPIFHVLPMS